MFSWYLKMILDAIFVSALSKDERQSVVKTSLEELLHVPETLLQAASIALTTILMAFFSIAALQQASAFNIKIFPVTTIGQAILFILWIGVFVLVTVISAMLIGWGFRLSRWINRGHKHHGGPEKKDPPEKK